MSCNKVIAALLLLGMASASCASTPTRWACPATLADGATTHTLDNAELYDGPPQQMASLIPEFTRTGARWDLDGVDPYLVCEYQGTRRTIALHAKGAARCVAGGKPFAAYCDDMH